MCVIDRNHDYVHYNSILRIHRKIQFTSVLMLYFCLVSKNKCVFKSHLSTRYS